MLTDQSFSDLARLDSKAALKILSSLSDFDIADFLSDFGGEIWHPNLWILPRNRLIEITLHYLKSTGPDVLIEWYSMGDA